MKLRLLFFLFLFFGIILSARPQEVPVSYKIIENIPYSEVYKGEKSDYLLERCKLDIYYPENKKDYATVVWFHGGGLTGGQKHIANELKNKGIAVVAVN